MWVHFSYETHFTSHNLYVVSTNSWYIFINLFYLVLKRRNKFTMWHAFPYCVLHNTEFFPCRRFCCVLPVCALSEEDYCIIQQRREEQRGGLLLVPIHVALVLIFSWAMCFVCFVLFFFVRYICVYPSTFKNCWTISWTAFFHYFITTHLYISH